MAKLEVVKRRVVVIIGAALVVGLLGLVPAVADTATVGHDGAAQETTFGHAGRWITDPEGRVIIFHGVNRVVKQAPFDPAQGVSDADMVNLASLGMNAMRVGVIWSALEPSPGIYDDAYIQQLVSFSQDLISHGIYPLLDFHQDQYGPAVGGDGAPAWATFTDGAPSQPECGFGCDYLVRPDVERAYDNFWADHTAPDGTGVQEHFAAAAARVATAMRPLKDLIGYEIENEMWPGSQYPTCIPAGCPVFDRADLSVFYAKVAAAIRTADPSHLIFAEPNALFNDGVASFINPLPGSQAGFAFHIYCVLSSADSSAEKPGGAQVCPAIEDRVITNAVSRVNSTGEALLMTEFGATPVTRPVAHITSLADQYMVPWMYWEYTEDFTADEPLLVRAYPQAVAGTPTSWGFDPATKVFHFTYSTAPASPSGLSAGATTEVIVPAYQYPHGYTVVVSGARVVSAPGAGVLELASLPGAATVNLEVSTAG